MRCALIALVVVLISAQASSAVDWPRFAHDERNSGYSDLYSFLEYDSVGVVWNYSIGRRVNNPVVADLDDDGYLEVLVGADDGVLYAFSSNGSLLWSFSTEGYVVGAAAVFDWIMIVLSMFCLGLLMGDCMH